MNLRIYMEANNLTDRELADAIDIDRSLVTRYRHGEYIPSARIILKIQQFTQGAVSLTDWVSKRKMAS
jgi:transcriptional regulator with XRE-family HTH domain